MCKNCKSTEMGIARQTEFDAALAQCKALNIKSGVAGFLAKHAYQRRVPHRYGSETLRSSEEERQVVKPYNAGKDDRANLYEEYEWEGGRKHDQECRERSVAHDYFTHGAKR